MHDDELEYCKDRIRLEMERCQSAPCPEVAERHRQKVLLYQAQFQLLATKHLPG